MPALDSLRALTPWRDPHSGIVSYILTQRVAPVQQSFYFTNPSLDRRGRYLWFFCCFPPGGADSTGRTLGVLNLEADTVQHFPETTFRDASPMVDPDSGEVYWCWEYAIYRREPAAAQKAVLVNQLPLEVHRRRQGKRLATHLTRSCDGRFLLIDAELGREWVVGALPVNGGPFESWAVLDRCYNHAQCSPTNPHMAVVPQDWWYDPADGAQHPYENRLYIFEKGQPPRAIFDPDRGKHHGHEWWDADGEHLWYIDYRDGTHRVNIHSAQDELVWTLPAEHPAGRICHSHCNQTGRYLVSDIGIYNKSRKAPATVTFLNRDTGKTVDLCSALPDAAESLLKYHVHPHPQFAAGDSLICYSTTVLGTVDVALTPVSDLVRATQ